MTGDFHAVLLIAMLFLFMSLVRSRNMGRRQRDMEDEIEHLRAERSVAAPAPGPTLEHMRRLEDRVRVLERIVTDRGFDVAAQIEALRDARADQHAVGDTAPHTRHTS